MDDQQRARELLAHEYAMAGSTKRADKIIAGFDVAPSTEYAIAAITAALRAAPEAVALRTAMTTLEQIASTPRNKGARMNAKATLLFLQTQLAARPQGVKE